MISWDCGDVVLVAQATSMISDAHNLQANLTRKDLYSVGAGPEKKGLLTAYWLYAGLRNYERYKTWCPALEMKIE